MIDPEMLAADNETYGPWSMKRNPDDPDVRAIRTRLPIERAWWIYDLNRGGWYDDGSMCVTWDVVVKEPVQSGNSDTQ